jgi:hypothetical protein
MKNIWKAVENTTNIAVIVGICLAAAFFYGTYKNNQTQAPRIGATLPGLAGYTWQSNSHSLVLALRKGCHFCEESMPFYRELYDVEKSDASKVKTVAVFPDTADEVHEILRAQNLPVPSVSQVDLSTLSVSGTPTLILVDRNGKVEKTWVGKLDAQGEESVLALVKKLSP